MDSFSEIVTKFAAKPLRGYVPGFTDIEAAMNLGDGKRSNKPMASSCCGEAELETTEAASETEPVAHLTCQLPTHVLYSTKYLTLTGRVLHEGLTNNGQVIIATHRYITSEKQLTSSGVLLNEGSLTLSHEQSLDAPFPNS